MNLSMITAICAAAVISGTPILYAALGGVINERAGVINLGMEGIMSVGAVVGFLVTIGTHNAWIGLIAAAIVGGAVNLILAFLSITLRTNQVVCGLAITIFGTGLANYLGRSAVGKPTPVIFSAVNVPLLSKIPFIGKVFFQHNILVYISYFLVIIIWLYLYKTRYGLSLRAIGENPSAADSLGVNIYLLRYVYVIIGGMLCGVGGAYLTLAYTPTWLEYMTAGRGWIAVALVIFAIWDPVRALYGAYIFGGVDALTYRLQAIGLTTSPFFLKMMPYLLTIIVLVFTVVRNSKKHLGSPGALGIPYDREER